MRQNFPKDSLLEALCKFLLGHVKFDTKINSVKEQLALRFASADTVAGLASQADADMLSMELKGKLSQVTTKLADLLKRES